MSNNPKLIVLNRKDFNNQKQLAGFSVSSTIDAFYWPHNDTIYVLKGNEDNKKLLCHEYGHAVNYLMSDHPEDFIGKVVHSFKVGCDVRAMGILRFKYGPADLVKQFEEWVKKYV